MLLKTCVHTDSAKYEVLTKVMSVLLVSMGAPEDSGAVANGFDLYNSDILKQVRFSGTSVKLRQ